MIDKKKFLSLTLMLLILASNASSVFAVSIVVSGENSGEISGDLSGEIPTGENNTSGETSGDTYLASIAKNSSITTNKNAPITSSMQTEISSGETNIRYVIETQPTHGTLLYEDNTIATFTYTPDKDYVGSDMFSFKITDGTLSSNSANVAITIKENSEPVIPFYYVDMQDHWANYSASHLAARGIVVGEEIANRYYFKPDMMVTRADFMLYLLAITESNTDAKLEIPKVSFEDEKMYPTWLLDAAKLAYAKGIISGSTQENKLYLNLYQNVTRAQAAVMISNVLKTGTETKELDYTDKNSIPAWATSAIKILTSYKIVQGDGKEFRPNASITKAETAEMCYKLLKQLENDNWNQNQTEDLK